jgi:hypothetical protein
VLKFANGKVNKLFAEHGPLHIKPTDVKVDITIKDVVPESLMKNDKTNEV